ncbi:hypothetical protein QI30_18710, partial [Kurthia sp. 3B1D]
MFKIILNIENIGIIANADIKIEGVTVIAGSNSSGKSTVGRVLYAIGTSLAESSYIKLFKQKLNIIDNELNRLKKISLDEESLAIAEEATALLDNMSYIISMLEEHPTSQKEFENQSINFSNKLKKIINSLEETVITQSLTTGNLEGEMEVDLDDILIRMSIKEIKKILDTDILKEDNLKFEMLQSVFNNEFNSQISNLTSNNLKSTISFTEVNNNSGKLVFIEDVLDREASTININREFVRPIFIDDPTVIDEISESIRIYLGGKKLSYNHKSYLIDLLKQTNSDENVFSKK